MLHGLGTLIFPVLVVAALFPGIALMNHLNYLDPYYWYLLLSPLVAVSFVTLLCLEVVALKWLLLGRIQAGRHRLASWYYARKWFVDKTMELSLDVVGPLYASVYLSPWYKLLGAKLGRGAEISTASFISPDLLSVGAESFIADNASLGALVEELAAAYTNSPLKADPVQYADYSEWQQQTLVATDEPAQDGRTFWLKAKYSTIANLNKAWATQRWSRP
jgi:hypothetical protein